MYVKVQRAIYLYSTFRTVGPVTNGADDGILWRCDTMMGLCRAFVVSQTQAVVLVPIVR